jgi:hypothetical protein
MIIFVFLLFICISSVLNILLKMTEKRHWGISLLLSVGLTLLTVALIGVK